MSNFKALKIRCTVDSSPCYGQLTHAHIGGDAAHINIRHQLLLDDLLQRCSAQLGVIEKRGVRVYVGVDALFHDLTAGVDLVLEVRVELSISNA